MLWVNPSIKGRIATPFTVGLVKLSFCLIPDHTATKNRSIGCPAEYASLLKFRSQFLDVAGYSAKHAAKLGSRWGYAVYVKMAVWLTFIMHKAYEINPEAACGETAHAQSTIASPIAGVEFHIWKSFARATHPMRSDRMRLRGI